MDGARGPREGRRNFPFVKVKGFGEATGDYGWRKLPSHKLSRCYTRAGPRRQLTSYVFSSRVPVSAAFPQRHRTGYFQGLSKS